LVADAHSWAFVFFPDHNLNNPDTDSLTSNDLSKCESYTEPSSMRTARPATSTVAAPLLEFRAHRFDMLPPCLIFLDGDGPADPLVARETR